MSFPVDVVECRLAGLYAVHQLSCCPVHLSPPEDNRGSDRAGRVLQKKVTHRIQREPVARVLIEDSQTGKCPHHSEQAFRVSTHITCELLARSWSGHKQVRDAELRDDVQRLGSPEARSQ